MTRSKEAGKPFYLYLPYTQVHIPPIPDPEYVGKTKRGNWADILTQMDDFTGVILDKLDELGLADDTIVVWASDNGADPTYHSPAIDPDPVGGQWHGFSGPWRGGLFTSLEGSNRTPCIVRWPGKVPAGKVSNELVHQVDLFTTLVNAGGAKVPDDRMIDGMDMSDFLLGDAEESGRDIVLRLQGNRLQAAKWHQWKVHLFKQDDFYSTWAPYNMPLLYNLEWDPREEHQVAFPHGWVIAPDRRRGRRVPEVAGGRAADQAGDARPVHAAEAGHVQARDAPADRADHPVRHLAGPGARRAAGSPPRHRAPRADEPGRRTGRGRGAGRRKRPARLLRDAKRAAQGPPAAGQADRAGGDAILDEVVLRVDAKHKAQVYDPRRVLAGTLTPALTWGLFGLLAGGLESGLRLGGGRRHLRRPVRLLHRAPAHQERAQAHRQLPPRGVSAIFAWLRRPTPGGSSSSAAAPARDRQRRRDRGGSVGAGLQRSLSEPATAHDAALNMLAGPLRR